MKNHLIAASILLVLLFGKCTSGPSAAEQMANKDSILKAQEDSLISAFMMQIESIDSKLSEVSTRNGIFDISNEFAGDASKESIMKRVEALDNLLEVNQAQLGNMLSKIKESTIRNEELENMLESMRLRIAQKEEQIDDLMELLTRKDMEIDQILLSLDSTRIQNIELAENVISLDEELHLVYYKVAEKKELAQQKIISKDGGLLGIGSIKQLNAGAIDKTKFTRVDERDLIEVSIYSKKATVITNHPKDSYKINFDENEQPQSLEILDRAAFWSVSDFLVVEVKN